MIDFTIETEIARPPRDVFAYVSDPAKLSSWQTNTLSALVQDEAPLALGTQIREVHRGPRGKELSSLVEVSTFEPPRAFALRTIEGALPIDGDIDFVPAGTGTLMSFRVHGRPHGALRLAEPLLRIALKRQFRAHCRTLKQVLEQGTAH
jgi:uncharacterized protein YndB with AHSA1/START domain